MHHRETAIIMSFPRIMRTTLRKMIYGFQGSQSDMNQLNDTMRRTLLILKDRGPKTMTQLHQAIGREKGSMTTVVGRLIEKGLVERKSVPHDRRLVNIDLTASGRKKTDILKKEIALFIHDKLGKLPPAEQERFYQAVEVLSDISKKL
jgi:DNA-binding MarR family transcriptional regulator